jgi:hypothetical protein
MGNDNSFYICCNPIASIKIENEIIHKDSLMGITIVYYLFRKYLIFRSV